MTASIFDVEVAARTLCQEARGEPRDGQEAVAHVIKNRLATGRWGYSLSSVCLWHGQFSGWGSGDPNFKYACGLQDEDPTLRAMVTLLNDVLGEKTDFTGGALFYYAVSIAAPYWVDEKSFCGQWGRHRFYRASK